MKWTHKGIDIQLEERNGKFNAMIHGECVWKTTLDAMKKAIDTALDKRAAFTPVDAFTFRDPVSHTASVNPVEDGLNKFKLVELRVEKSRRRGYVGDTVAFVRSPPNSYRSDTVYSACIDDPDNVKAVREYLTFCKAWLAADSTYRAKANKLRENIRVIRASEYNQNKKA